MKTREQVEASISSLELLKKQLEVKLETTLQNTASSIKSETMNSLQLINNHIEILKWIIE